MGCEMCGYDGKLYKVRVEGTTMDVCNNCSKYGQVIEDVSVHIVKRSRREEKEEPEEMICQGYNRIIKRKRENLDKTQEEFAKMLNEKESVIQHIESGKMKPSISLARKIEKKFSLSLIEYDNIEYEPKKTSATKEGFTLGDMITIKKRKK